MYDLVAVVIHIGSSLNRGHYISIVKSDGFWLLFDDDIVDVSVETHTHTHTWNKILSNEIDWRNNVDYNISPELLKMSGYVGLT